MDLYFVTPHGSYKIAVPNDEQTLQEICWFNKIPLQNVTFYGINNEIASIIVGKHKAIKDVNHLYHSIIIRPDRNIDYWSVCRKNIKLRPSLKPVAEYTFPSQGARELHHFEFSVEECKKYVLKNVLNFLENEVKVCKTSKVVLGISGGGDSNTLIEAFLNSRKVTNDQIIAVMMLGIPDWDKGKFRASEICEKYGVELKFVDSQSVNKLLNRTPGRDWVEDFEQIFPDADLEVLGTLAVRLALVNVAKSENAQAIVTGLNLEDILAECFLSIIQGKSPPSFPVRIIDEMPLWYPLYNIPKKILDGCYPKYSLANYEDRYPSKMLGRANVYYMAQMMHSIMPGAEFDLLNGFKKLANKNQEQGFYDEKIGFTVAQELPQELKNRWLMFTQM